MHVNAADIEALDTILGLVEDHTDLLSTLSGIHTQVDYSQLAQAADLRERLNEHFHATTQHRYAP